MDLRQKHIKYREIEFKCSIMNPVLSDEELDILKEYGTWMEALLP